MIDDTTTAFITRWSAAGGSERAKSDIGENAYGSERRVSFHHGDGGSSNGYIDCYRRGAFVLEAKKLKAGGARSFDDALPADEGRPPFARLAALNAERGAEEAAGHVRWLRPGFQNPSAVQTALPVVTAVAGTVASAPVATIRPWPTDLPAQMAAVAAALGPVPQSETQIAARFSGRGKWKNRLPDILAALAALGRARAVAAGHWTGAT